MPTRHPLDILARHLAAAPFGEAEFCERVLHRNPTAVARWFDGRPIPATMQRALRLLVKVRVVGDELHVVYRYAAPVKRSKLQRDQLRARALARKDWRNALATSSRETKQGGKVAAAKRR